MRAGHHGRGDRRPADDRGITLVEAVVAFAVLALLAAAFGQTLYGALGAARRARALRLAEEIAATAVEQARHLPYEDLGVVSGNPPGVLPSEEDVTVDGFSFGVRRSVGYVDDPLPGGFQTGANYKVFRVRVEDEGGSDLAALDTIVAPPTQPSLNKSVVKVQVVDDVLNEPVAGALVQLLNGPSSPRGDLSDAAGEVVFAALEPNPLSGGTAHYDLDVSAAGYVVVPADLPPAPAVHAQLSPGQLFATAVRVFRPVELTLSLLDAGGLPFAGEAAVDLTWDGGSATLAVAGGAATVTSAEGQALLPGQEYTIGAHAAPDLHAASITRLLPDAYPDVTSAAVALTLTPWPSAALRVTVRDAGSAAPLAGRDVVATGGPAGASVAGTTDATGVAVLSVPWGAGDYTVVVPAQGTHGAGAATSVVPEAGAAVVIGVTAV